MLSWKEYPGKKRVNRRKSRLEYRKGKLNGSGNLDLQFNERQLIGHVNTR